MKTRVLVTGANGYIGNALILFLLGRPEEFTVTACARRGQVLESKRLKVHKCGNLEDNPDYTRLLRDVDTVIHTASLTTGRLGPAFADQSALHRANVLGLIHLARQAHRSGVKRFVFVSSIEVNGEVTPPGKRFFADSQARPRFAYGMSMLEAEKELKRVGQETGMEIVIVRPPMVYGPESGHLFGAVRTMVRLMLPLPLLSCRDNRRSLISIDNLTDFLALVSRKKEAANQTFLVSDDQDLSTVEIFQLLAKTSGRSSLLWPFPRALLKLFNSYIGRQAWEDFFFESQAADINKTKVELGWTPPQSVQDAFARSWSPRLLV